ncbi:MAG: hypothetical protein ACK5GN_01560 [Pseudomonadota bacterium]
MRTRSAYTHFPIQTCGRILLGLVTALMIAAHMCSNFFSPPWLDEYATWWVTRGSFLDAVISTSPYSPHPLFYGSVWGVVRVFGVSPFALRLVSAASTCLTIVLVYHYCKKQLRLDALTIGAILALLPFLITKVDARPYSMGLLFGFCSMLYAWRGLDRKNFALAYLFCCLAFITHQSFITTFCIPISIYLFDTSKSLRTRFTAIFAFALLSALFAQLISMLWSRMASVEASREVFYYTHASLISYLLYSPLPSIVIMGIGCALLSSVIDMIAVGPKGILREITRLKGVRAGVLIMTGTVTVVLLLSMLAGASLLFDRYLLVVVLGALMIISSVVAQLQSQVSRLSFVMISLVLSFYLLLLNKQSLPKTPISETVLKSLLNEPQPAKSQGRRLLIVESSHASALNPENNKNPRYSSAWTSQVEYYLRQKEDAVVLPLVHGAISPLRSSDYTLPWGSFDLLSFEVIEVFTPEFRYPPAAGVASALHSRLIELSFTVKERMSESGLSKTVFAN